MANVIETKKLTKYYGKTIGIKDLDLSVDEGEILGFIGPNGAGKSTTIRLLLSLIYPTGGSATIFDKDVISEGAEIRKDIGYLPSEVFYYENMRVKDLLNYSASFYGKDCSARIKELSEALDLDLSKKIDDLSYGNKKKVGIVQGLLHSPRLIILDEPTGGLDPLKQRTFFDILKEENKKGVTVFFSSHILSEVQRLCHRVAIVKEGSLINIASMSELEVNYKRIKLTLRKEASKDLFDLSGVNDLQVSGTQASFLYKGDINLVIAKLGQMELADLFIDEPDLEEIFMHYYQ